MVAIQILKYPILIFQAAISSFLRLSFLDGGVRASVLEARGAGGGD
jgi:hypothetical protein